MRRLWTSGVGRARLAKRIVALLTESRALLLLATATAVLQSALFVPIALVVRHMFDVEIPHRRTGSIILSGVLILGLYAATAGLSYVTRAAAARTTAGISARLRLDLLAKVYALPQSWHDRRRAGEVHSVLVRDPERIEAMLSSVAGAVLPAVLVGTCLVVVACVVSPRLFLTEVVVVPPLLVGARFLAAKLRRSVQAWAASSRRYSAEAQLLLRAMVSTKVAGAERWELEQRAPGARELAERYRALGSAAAGFHALQNAVAAAAGTAVLVVGGLGVAQHTMTLGHLLAFYAVLGLLLRQLHAASFQSDTMVIGLQSLADVDALLARHEEDAYGDHGRTITFRGGVAVRGVSFAYEDEPVLTEVSFALSPSEHVALIGPNGAGKSTVVNLLLGLYQPGQGELRADDAPYCQLNVSDLRRQVGVVLQDPVLLPGTLSENIAYSRPEASAAEIRAAAQAATAADFIEALPDGYATVIGDEGTGLSGGQRQRVAIARALLGAPALLILDEPTTYLDQAAVTALMARLMALPQAPTVLLVTHDPDVAGHVERVIELRDGQIVGDRPQCVAPAALRLIAGASSPGDAAPGSQPPGQRPAAP
ncbi:MAG: ABC transporter ATP-binding protein [Solirubrobacteraceae bacterium]